MSSDLPMLEPDINSLVREYLIFSGLEKTSYALQMECKEKGKVLPASPADQTDGSKLAAQVLNYTLSRLWSAFTFY